MVMTHIDVRYLAVTLKIRTHGRRIVRRSHVNVDIFDRSHHGHVLSLDTMEILDTFIHLYSFIYTDTLWNTLVYFGTFNIMDNKNDSSDQTLNHVDGSNETIHLLMTVIVMDDSSENETDEEEEVEKNEKKEEEAEDQDQDKQKQRKHISAPVLNVQQVTPNRAERAHEHRTDAVTFLKPASTLTPAPIPSDLFPPPQLPDVENELQIATQIDIILANTSPMLDHIPISLSPPTSPLPELDLTIDIMECFQNTDTVEALEERLLKELPDLTDSDLESMLSVLSF